MDTRDALRSLVKTGVVDIEYVVFHTNDDDSVIGSLGPVGQVTRVDKCDHWPTSLEMPAQPVNIGARQSHLDTDVEIFQSHNVLGWRAEITSTQKRYQVGISDRAIEVVQYHRHAARQAIGTQSLTPMGYVEQDFGHGSRSLR